MKTRWHLPAFAMSFFFLSASVFGQEDLDTAIRKLADTISQSMTAQKKTKIAVIPFQDLSSDAITTFGKYVAEELTTGLFNSGKFSIVERNLLSKVLDELKLAQTGAVDPASAKELGKITGVDAVVTGTIQDLFNRVALNCRIIETETGNIFAAASEKVIKDETISKLLGQVASPLPKTKSIEKESSGGAIMPRTLDASGYLLESVNSISPYGHGYSGWIFDAQLISFEENKTTILKLFILNHKLGDLTNDSILFKLPTLTDEKGNEYSALKVSGKVQEVSFGLTVGERSRKTGVYSINVPIDGRSPVAFEFPLIPANAKTILFSFNNKQIEINWQDLSKKELK